MNDWEMSIWERVALACCVTVVFLLGYWLGTIAGHSLNAFFS